MEPTNYTSAFTDLPSPQASFMQGVKDGAGIEQLQLQQQQAQLAAQQQLQMRADLAALSKNPTTQAIGAMSLKYPALSENFKRSFDILDPAQKQAKLDHATQVYAALHNKQPDIAIKILTDQATAQRNSGNEQDAKSAETMAELIKAHPEFAQTTAGLMISAAVGPDKFASTFPAIAGEERAQDLHPSAVSKAESEAVTAGVAASVAQDTFGAKVDQAKEDVLTAQHKRKIDDLNVQISQANSETERGRLILERDKLIAEQAKTKQADGAGAQDAMDSANALLEQIHGVANHPGINAGTGTMSGIRSYFNSSDGNDFQKAVAGLKAPVFLNELGKLKAAGITLGAVTEAEGKKLEQRIANLDTDQSTPAFKNQVGVLLKDTEKFIAKIQASGKLPTKGGALVVNHPTLGPVNEGDVNRLLTKFPGSTRAQVLEYLKQGGK